MNFIAMYWKKIVTILFVLLFLTMCTKNCSKSNQIREIEQSKMELQHKMDTISLSINNKDFLIDSLHNEIKNLTMERDIYKDIASNYQTTLDNLSKRNTSISVNVPEINNKNKE
jgi:chromosome segregation ATPase